MATTSLAQVIYTREYRKKHNYMSCPGDTKMPEYSTEEIRDIEDGNLKQWEIAKKYNRSTEGIQNKKYRIKNGKRYYAVIKRSKENYQRIMKNKPLVLEVKHTEVEDATLSSVLSGEMSISAFLTI